VEPLAAACRIPQQIAMDGQRVTVLETDGSATCVLRCCDITAARFKLSESIRPN
jgi:uncharacterized protein YhfF